jgi:large subunit ribosomal protein L3
MAEIKVPGLIGKKLGMTHVFADDGSAIPVTVVEAGPCKITQVKTKDKDGYDALQLGYGAVKPSRVNKPRKGHFDAAKTEPLAMLKEFRVDDAAGYTVGSGFNVTAFQVGARVDVVGTSIGKGFAGVVKRHKFHGGPETHGSKSHDVPGSIGNSAYPGRVWPGQKLPGHHGAAQVTIRKVSVVGVDPEKNLLLLKGAVPGKRNSILTLRPSAGVELMMPVEEEPVEPEAPVEEPEAVEEKKTEASAPAETAEAKDEASEETKAEETESEEKPEKEEG